MIPQIHKRRSSALRKLGKPSAEDVAVTRAEESSGAFWRPSESGSGGYEEDPVILGDERQPGPVRRTLLG